MQQEIWFHKYRIIRLLGRGGTARVYLAEHIRLHSYRAIKVISKSNPLYELQLKEAQILKNLKHSCIPIVYDIEENEEGSYIIEQYLEGETLKEFMEEKGSLDTYTMVQFALQICDLIHYLHNIDRPLLYLDLKPDNIIVSGTTLKLVDFGSAIYNDEVEEGSMDYYGTRGYAAPEQYRHEELGERSDVYGIGMLLYYMIFGKAPQQFSQSMDNIDFNRTCPKKLRKIINRCLKFNPSQRYASVIELSKALSAGGRRLQGLCKPGSSIRIAIAGAQSRVGVTHLSFRLCRFFMKKAITCIYTEKNNSGVIRSIRNRYENLPATASIYRLRGLSVFIRNELEEDFAEYSVVIEDLGNLTEKNLPSFLEADMALLVMGGKDWELKYSEDLLASLKDCSKVAYLFNYLDGRQFGIAVRQMEHRSCFRIPYEPDPYARHVTGAELEFFEELTSWIWRGLRNEKKIHATKKGTR